jgi:hypothetical protein
MSENRQMFLKIRMLPGEHEVPLFRAELSPSPAERPIVPPNIRGADALRVFLTERLGQTNAQAHRTISQLEAQPSSPVLQTVRIDANELATIVKEMDRNETQRLNSLG